MKQARLDRKDIDLSDLGDCLKSQGPPAGLPRLPGRGRRGADSAGAHRDAVSIGVGAMRALPGGRGLAAWRCGGGAGEGATLVAGRTGVVRPGGPAHPAPLGAQGGRGADRSGAARSLPRPHAAAPGGHRREEIRHLAEEARALAVGGACVHPSRVALLVAALGGARRRAGVGGRLSARRAPGGGEGARGAAGGRRRRPGGGRGGAAGAAARRARPRRCSTSSGPWWTRWPRCPVRVILETGLLPAGGSGARRGPGAPRWLRCGEDLHRVLRSRERDPRTWCCSGTASAASWG